MILSNSDLTNANLYGARLNDANLQNANLQNANLSNARLKGANLENADLRGANLNNVDLEMANLKGTILDRYHPQYTNTRNTKLAQNYLHRAWEQEKVFAEQNYCLINSGGCFNYSF